MKRSLRKYSQCWKRVNQAVCGILQGVQIPLHQLSLTSCPQVINIMKKLAVFPLFIFFLGVENVVEDGVVERGASLLKCIIYYHFHLALNGEKNRTI